MASSSTDETWFVYILRCKNGAFYTGITNDLVARYRMHQQGKGGKYTRAFRPTELVGFATVESRSDALKAELAIKKLSREEKINGLLSINAEASAHRK